MNKKLSYVILALVVVLAFAFAAPSSADAEWVIKNNTSQTIYVAIAYWDGDTWVSEGWFNIGPYAEKVVLSADLEYEDYYLYAETDEVFSSTWDGDYWFLVDEDDAFTYYDADQGTNRYQSKGFMKCSASGEGENMTTYLSD